MKNKPLGTKSYGHIPHLPGSRIGPGDHKCDKGQSVIATKKPRDKHDRIIVQEKVDGSNVGVARIDDVLYPLTRSGYIANSSPYEQHVHFYNWVMKNQDRFLGLLNNGERACGEWLMQAHGTRYELKHEPFVLFDIMIGTERKIYDELKERNRFDFILPYTFHTGPPLLIESALKCVTTSWHGAIDQVEGVVYRIERNELINPGKNGDRKWKVDFLVKYVMPDKKDGIYLPEISGKKPIWNWRPE